MSDSLHAVMVSSSNASSSSSTTTTTAHEAAPRRIVINDVWLRVERAKAELGLLRTMKAGGLGVPQLTSMINRMGGARKSNRGGGQWEKKTIDDLMDTKIDDAKQHLKEEEIKLREEVEWVRTVMGMEERRVIRLMKRARQKAARVIRKVRKKNKRKLINLRRKKQNTETDKKRKEEESKKSNNEPFRDLEIFEVKSHEEEEMKKLATPDGDAVMTIGVVLTPEEREVLSLPPKTSINPVLKGIEFETNIQVCHTKARYSLRDELGDFTDKEEGKKNDPSGEEEMEEDRAIRNKIKEMEARTRLIYDDMSNTLDMGRRKATDLTQNS